MTRSAAHLSIRIDLGGGRFGPGKAALLRAIGDSGSISAAARRMGMSYARAWSLTESMNRSFSERLVETFAGGSRRGGARLTEAGRQVLDGYAAIVAAAEIAAADELAAIASLSAPAPEGPRGRRRPP